MGGGEGCWQGGSGYLRRLPVVDRFNDGCLGQLGQAVVALEQGEIRSWAPVFTFIRFGIAAAAGLRWAQRAAQTTGTDGRMKLLLFVHLEDSRYREMLSAMLPFPGFCWNATQSAIPLACINFWLAHTRLQERPPVQGQRGEGGGGCGRQSCMCHCKVSQCEWNRSWSQGGRYWTVTATGHTSAPNRQILAFFL